MIWMSLPTPGQVYRTSNPDAFVHSSSLNHIAPLETIGRLLSQSSGRCFTKSLPLVPAAFNLFTNSRAGTQSSPYLLGGEDSLSHSCSEVTSGWKADLCVGKGSGGVLSYSLLLVKGPAIWGPSCFAAPEMLSFLTRFPGVFRRFYLITGLLMVGILFCLDRVRLLLRIPSFTCKGMVY